MTDFLSTGWTERTALRVVVQEGPVPFDDVHEEVIAVAEACDRKTPIENSVYRALRQLRRKELVDSMEAPDDARASVWTSTGLGDDEFGELQDELEEKASDLMRRYGHRELP